MVCLSPKDRVGGCRGESPGSRRGVGGESAGSPRGVGGESLETSGALVKQHIGNKSSHYSREVSNFLKIDLEGAR